MKLIGILTAVVFSASLYAETVVKLSAPFSFPTTVGVAQGILFQGKDASFSCGPTAPGRECIELSWALPANTMKGNISIYLATGKKVKTFALSSAQGSVKWDASGAGKQAGGVYFATLSSGTWKKNLKIVVYR